MGNLSEYHNLRHDGTIGKKLIRQLKITFKEICVELIVNSYHNYLKDTQKTFKSDEPTITAGLYNHIQLLILSTEIPCTIVPEFPEYTSEMKSGNISPKKAKKYDLCFIHFNVKLSHHFGVEAKLLIEDNYQNKKANLLIKEYVRDKGMGKYINNKYIGEGLMLGYIIKGDTSNITKKINLEIINIYSSTDTLKQSSKFRIMNFIYVSKHKSLSKELIHIFLDFNRYCI